jgi:transcriptional regulator GlxA family with amidase domain
VDGRIFRLTRLLNKRLDHPWTVEEMARIVDLSRPHLQKLFKANTGISPVAYLKDVRLQRACELLESTFLQIKRIGYETGHGNDSHFTRDFKKKYGMTPSQYRKSFWATEQSHGSDGQK